MPKDRVAAGHGDPHDGLSAADGGVRRRLHLRDAGRPGLASASSPGSTTAIRCSIRTSRSSTSSGIRSSRRCSTGGQMVRYGAKALPEGGWHTIPRVYADGVLIAGDAGGFLNSMRLKGIHLAMRTGMLAAETGVRRGARRRRRRRRSCRPTSAASTAATCAASCIRCATSTRASATACSPASRIPGCRS